MIIYNWHKKNPHTWCLMPSQPLCLHMGDFNTIFIFTVQVWGQRHIFKHTLTHTIRSAMSKAHIQRERDYELQQKHFVLQVDEKECIVLSPQCSWARHSTGKGRCSWRLTGPIAVVYSPWVQEHQAVTLLTDWGSLQLHYTWKLNACTDDSKLSMGRPSQHLHLLLTEISLSALIHLPILLQHAPCSRLPKKLRLFNR